MRSSTRWRCVLVYIALVSGFGASIALALFASSTVRDLRAYHALMPHIQTYVFSYREGAPGPEMSFDRLLSLHIFLQWFGLALALFFTGWIFWKASREMQRKDWL